MAAEQHVEVVNNVFAALSSRDFDKGAALMADEAEWLDVPTGRVHRGSEGFHQLARKWDKAFPDLRFEVVRMSGADDGTVVVELIGRGTHTGPFEGLIGTIGATGRRIEIRICDVFSVKEGKIASARKYYDLATLMREIELGTIAPRAA